MIPFISSHLIKMVGISSKLCHHTPPLLQAFDLSNQSFSLFQNTKVASFSDHHSIILTKSPSFPPHSFLPQNPLVGNFPSMASSVARMPSDEWLHHHPLCHDDSTHNPYPKMTHLASTDVISLYCQTSPNTSNTVSIAVDISSTVHASSFMQIRKKPAPPTNAAIVPIVMTEEPSGRSSTCIESKLSAKEIMGNAPATPLLPPTPDYTDEKALGVTRRQEMDDFILKLEEERRRKLIELAERHRVSQFPFLSYIQSLIRLKSLRQKITAIRHHQWSQKLQEERFEIGSNSFFLRKGLEERERHDNIEAPTEENIIVMEVQELDSHVIVLEISFDHSDSENNPFLDLISTRDIESSPQAFYSTQAFFVLPFGYKDRQETQIIDASWDEINLWGSNLNWQRSSNSHILRTWHDEIPSEGIDISTQVQHVAIGESNWLLQPSNSRRGWGK